MSRQDGSVVCETFQGQEVPLLLDLVSLASSSGLHETLALLTSQLRPDSNHREEMGFLRDVFSEKSLSYLMKVNPRWLSLPPPPSLREALSVPSQPLPCPWKVSNSLVRAFQICCYGGDPACGPRCHHNPGCCVWYLG